MPAACETCEPPQALAPEAWDELAAAVAPHLIGGEARARRAAAALRGSLEAGCAALHLGPTGEDQALPLLSPHGLRLFAAWLRRHRGALPFASVTVMWPRATPEFCGAVAELAPALPPTVEEFSVNGYLDPDAVAAVANALRRGRGGLLTCDVVDIPRAAEPLGLIAQAPGHEVRLKLRQGLKQGEEWSLPSRDGDVGEPSCWWRFPVGCWVEAAGLSCEEMNGRPGRIVTHHAGQAGDRVGVDFGGDVGNRAVRPDKLAPVAPPPEAADVPEPTVPLPSKHGKGQPPAPTGPSAAYDPRSSAGRPEAPQGAGPQSVNPAGMFAQFSKAMQGGAAPRAAMASAMQPR